MSRLKKYDRYVFCKNCWFYVSLGGGRGYCMKHDRETSPYGQCSDYEVFEKASIRKKMLGY